MASSIFNPSIVINGLVLLLDSGNVISYPQTGSTWTDLSGNGNSGTLFNSPTFTSGYFTFNGSNQYVSFGKQLISNLSSSTVSIWVKVSSGGAMYCERDSSGNDIFKIDNGSSFDGYTIGFVQRNDAGNLTQVKTSTSIRSGNWTNICVTNNCNAITIYLNGVLSTTGSITNSTLTNSGIDARLGADKGDGTQYYSGNISSCLLYNRALTAQETQQNYNALKGRFGLS